MKTKIIIYLSTLAVFLATAVSAGAQSNSPVNQQSNANQGVLEVQGQGQMRVQPDQTLVRIHVQTTNTEAGRAVQVVTERVEQLLKKLQDAGFKKDEIKTSHFSLNENNQWMNDRLVRQGYTASQTMEVKFALDPKRMTRLTTVFAETQEGVTFNFSFGLSDKLKQQTKEELIRRALQDAREKASIIARSSNIRLGAIHKIDYTPKGYSPYGPMEVRAAESMMMDKQAQFPQTEIQDIELTDQILVIWALEQ